MARTFHRDKTRQQVAAELLARLQYGPRYSRNFDGSPLDPDRLRDQYRCWAESWILTEVCKLIPELKDNLDSFGYYRAKETGTNVQTT